MKTNVYGIWEKESANVPIIALVESKTLEISDQTSFCFIDNSNGWIMTKGQAKDYWYEN